MNEIGHNRCINKKTAHEWTRKIKLCNYNISMGEQMKNIDFDYYKTLKCTKCNIEDEDQQHLLECEKYYSEWKKINNDLIKYSIDLLKAKVNLKELSQSNFLILLSIIKNWLNDTTYLNHCFQ